MPNGTYGGVRGGLISPYSIFLKTPMDLDLKLAMDAKWDENGENRL